MTNSSSVWRLSNDKVPAWNGTRRDAVWLHLPLRNVSDASEWVLRFDYPMLQRIDVVVLRDGLTQWMAGVVSPRGMPSYSDFSAGVAGALAAPETRYFVCLGLVVVLTWFASNLVHGKIGRSWMAVRDMDIAAELMGIKLLNAKLLAFAVSSYYCGVAGACMMFLWYGGGKRLIKAGGGVRADDHGQMAGRVFVLERLIHVRPRPA